jgi:predicted site-specific integrase-resolvase
MDNDERMARIEERLERLSGQITLEKQAVDARLDQMATKADLERAMNSMLKWMVGTTFGAGVVAMTVMTFVLNNAVPRAAAVSPPPVIIQLPPASQASPGKLP